MSGRFGGRPARAGVDETKFSNQTILKDDEGNDDIAIFLGDHGEILLKCLKDTGEDHRRWYAVGWEQVFLNLENLMKASEGEIKDKVFYAVRDNKDRSTYIGVNQAGEFCMAVSAEAAEQSKFFVRQPWDKVREAVVKAMSTPEKA